MRDAYSRMYMMNGEQNSDSRLITFLYLLARDHLPVGIMESVARQILEGERITTYTNGWLATWAEDLANRLGDV